MLVSTDSSIKICFAEFTVYFAERKRVVAAAAVVVDLAVEAGDVAAGEVLHRPWNRPLDRH